MIDDNTFNAKFFTVIDIFKDWMPEDFDFAKASVLDFGCEFGVMTLGIASRLKPRRVVGVDINSLYEQLPDLVNDKVLEEFPSNIEFCRVDPVERLSLRFQFDVIFTWSTFEHVNQPNLDQVVKELYDCLSPRGFLFLQIQPLYYSAFGSHLETLVDEPWAHLSMQHNLLRHAVMTAPKADVYKHEDDQNYEAIKAGIWSCYETLNKITADELVELFGQNGFDVLRQRRTECSPEPPESLIRIYSRDVLKTDQVVVLFQKRAQTLPQPEWRWKRRR